MFASRFAAAAAAFAAGWALMLTGGPARVLVSGIGRNRGAGSLPLFENIRNLPS